MRTSDLPGWTSGGDASGAEMHQADPIVDFYYLTSGPPGGRDADLGPARVEVWGRCIRGRDASGWPNSRLLLFNAHQPDGGLFVSCTHMTHFQRSRVRWQAVQRIEVAISSGPLRVRKQRIEADGRRCQPLLVDTASRCRPGAPPPARRPQRSPSAAPQRSPPAAHAVATTGRWSQ